MIAYGLWPHAVRHWHDSHSSSCCSVASVAVVYVIGGIIVMKFVMKREGKEVFPNYTFWTSGPGYVVVSCCSWLICGWILSCSTRQPITILLIIIFPSTWVITGEYSELSLFWEWEGDSPFVHKVLYQLAVIEGGKYFASYGHASNQNVYITASCSSIRLCPHISNTTCVAIKQYQSHFVGFEFNDCNLEYYMYLKFHHEKLYIVGRSLVCSCVASIFSVVGWCQIYWK